MSHLIALIFDDQFKGEEARATLHRMAGEGFLDIDDTVLITRRFDGKIAVSQEDQALGRGQKTGHVAGLVAAAITGTFPLALAGTVGGHLVGRLMDHGLTHKFVKDVKQELEPGTSALIILGESDPERRQAIAERLRDFEPRVLESDLPEEVRREIEREIREQRAA